MKFIKRLEGEQACTEAVEWVNGRGMKRAYDECERADWMLWIFGKMAGRKGWPTREEVVLAACDCAETSVQHWKKSYPNDDRPQKAIAVARRWAKGRATIGDVRSAADAACAAAYAAYAAAHASYAASYAAYAALRSLNLYRLREVFEQEINTMKISLREDDQKLRGR